MADDKTEEKNEEQAEERDPLMIWEDKDGNVLDAQPRGKGRPPADVEETPEGNYVLRGCVMKDGEILTPKAQISLVKRGADGDPVSYVTLDADGEEVERERKGRGRPRNGFEKIDDKNNPLHGHWVMTLEEEEEEEAKVTPKDETTEVDASDDADAQAQAEADAAAAAAADGEIDLSGLESGLDVDEEETITL